MDRRLAAIFAADVAGYSRLIGEAEESTVRAMQAHQDDILPMISEQGGRVIDLAGDGILAEFPSVVAAVGCATAIQARVANRNSDLPADRRLEFRIGINQGEIVLDRGRVYGDGINVAARLQALAEPGGIAISDRVYEDVVGKLDIAWQDIGEQELKNIVRPVHVWLWPSRQAPELRQAPAERPSVAVLPFDNLSGQPEETYFSDGITEDIITGLAHFRSLSVIARNSSFAFRDKPTGLPEIGRRLGASYILEGSVRRAGERVRITAQLIEAATGLHLWAERYDRKLEDIFNVQEEVARMIVATLAGRIQDERLRKALRKPTANLQAHDCMLRGLANLRGYGDDNQSAYEMFERAIALDPHYALAHANLAEAYLGLHGYAAASPEVFDRAFGMASRALELDPQESNAHHVLALIWLFRRDFDASEQHFRRAIELNPNDADGILGLGYILVLRGHPEEALEAMQEGIRLNPFMPSWYSVVLGVTYYSLSNYVEAVQAFRRIPTPGYWVRARLAATYGQLGSSAAAEAEVAKILEEKPGFTIREFFVQDVLLERVEDREHLRDGLVKAGLPG
jgi:adenylate cyclase